MSLCAIKSVSKLSNIIIQVTINICDYFGGRCLYLPASYPLILYWATQRLNLFNLVWGLLVGLDAIIFLLAHNSISGLVLPIWKVQAQHFPGGCLLFGSTGGALSSYSFSRC